MDNLPYISEEKIEEITDFQSLIEALGIGFRGHVITPMRHHHDYQGADSEEESTLLLMPAWETNKNVGIKVVTVSPENGKRNLPAIHGVYLYLDATTGVPQALMDGKALTAKRTAAASALASTFLSRPDSETLLMIGTGALAPNLIQAHCAVRPIKKVWLWGRNYEKARALAKSISIDGVEILPIEDLDTHVPQADIISSATLSKKPIIKGELLVKGQHIDLVGSYKKDMREADDDVIKAGSIFVDTWQGGLKESGDIVIALEQNVITEEEIKADLIELCKDEHKGRSGSDEITVFKSVGHASEDLIAANYYFEKQKLK